MEASLIKPSDKIVPLHLVRVGDLLNYEGPLLALYEEVSTGKSYLFDWVDRDKVTNRWLVYSVPADSLLQFIAGRISHLDLFKHRQDETVLYTDMRAADRIDNCCLYELNEVPLQYYPNEKTFFDPLDSPDYNKIEAALLKHLFFDKQKQEIQSVSA